MNYHSISILINVVSSVHHLHPQYHHQEIVLINRLNNFFKFDHNIFLIDSSADTGRFMHPANQRDVIPTSSFHFTAYSDGVIEGLEILTRIESKNPLVIVVIESGSLEGNSSLPARLVKIHRLQRNMKIGFFISQQFAGDGVLQQLFRWCWNNGIMNVFSATYDPHDSWSDGIPLNIFKFDPFVTFRVINITEIESVDSIFPNTTINFQLHPLRFPRQQLVTTLATEMQKIFCRAMNATETSSQLIDIDIIPMLNVFISDRHREITAWKGLSMYPIKMTTFVILVPEAKSYPNFSSYLRIMLSGSLLGWSIGIIAFLVILLAVTRYEQREWKNICRSAVDVINLLMGDNSAIRYQKLLRAEATLIVSLTFAGFFMVNGISSEYQSFFTQPIMQPQINTIDSLYKSTIPLFVTPGYWQQEILASLKDRFKQHDWSGKIRPLNTSDLNREILLRNSSISFFTLDTAAEMLIASQRRLSVQGYRVLTEGGAFMNKLSSFYVNENFAFIEHVNDISLRTQSVGLYKKWTDDDTHYRSKIINVSLNKASDTEYFLVPVFIIHGWIAGCLVFGIEIFWRALTSWNSRRLE